MVVEYIMRIIKEKIVELKNIYSGEIVFSSNLYEKRVDGTMTFIQVYKSEDPQRKYLVNSAAFVKVHK
jgi:hypothetical protein